MRKIAATLAVASASLASALAISISGPLSLGELQALTKNAHYGPQSPLAFADGPLLVSSGTEMELFASPKSGQAGADSVLFLVSLRDASFAGSLYFGISSGSDSGTVSLGNDDFYSTSDAGFPANIKGIGHGEVNGIVFPDAYHAAVQVTGFGLGNMATETGLAELVITTPLGLRVDVFGVSSQRVIINNSPNSHSLGVVAIPDGGLTALLLGLGFGSLAIVRRRAGAHAPKLTARTEPN